MTVDEQHFEVRRGQALVIEDTIAGDEPMDAWTFEVTFRGKESSLVTLTIEDAAITVSDRVVSIPLTRAQTTLLTEQSYLWSLWRTDDGSENPLTEGMVTVVRNSRGN